MFNFLLWQFENVGNLGNGITLRFHRKGDFDFTFDFTFLPSILATFRIAAA